MAKKRQTKSAQAQTAEETNLPDYVWQSQNITAMQADLSKQQIRILVGMMKSIQDGVRKMFERGPNKEQQLLLFPDMQKETDTVDIEFKFSDIAVRPDAYRDVQAIANKFMTMVFRYEDKDRGEVTLEHFVHKVTYPKRGSKRDKIRFTFTKDQAEAAFNFARYSRYMLSVALEADSKHTVRLYWLICSARGFDRGDTGTFHWYVTYEELRRILGCDEKDGKGKWVRKRQKLYKHFKADVLRVAESELKELADAGKCDCWFEFVELPDDFVGDPQRFDFVVHSVDPFGTRQIASGTPRAVLAADPETEGLRKLLLSFGMQRSSADELIGMATGRYDLLTEKAQALKRYYDEKRAGQHPETDAIADYAGHAVTSLRNFLAQEAAQPQAAAEQMETWD